ncbi:unnamed protein product [Linum trigynum]|uniref:GATA transcription factor n=1 Tax=Linum trigynum TaxID=586398 RepID=A0AAV2EMN4_9ROSI
MVGPTPNFMDELDCGSFFDQIDDLIDFPSDNLDAVFTSCPVDDNDRTISAAKNDAVDESFPPPSIWAAHPGSVFPNHGGPDLAAELSVPYEDIVQLEWLSTFVEDSFSGGSLTMNKNECSLLVDKDFSTSSSSTTTLSQQQQHFRTSSPVSVLESSSSCSGEQKPASAPLSPEVNVGGPGGRCGRARSKRPRPATFTPRPAMQQLIVSPTSSITETTTPMCPVTPTKLTPRDSDNHAESRLLIKIPKHLIKSEQKNKKKKQKKVEANVPPPPLGMEEQNNESGTQQQQQQGVRKCMHCEVTKTPQWRAGPMGPKSLCNACGVRFKSGRLFPEYRPAASPTFVPALHSNSHKKVVEMRTKTPIGGEIFGMATGDDASMVPGSPELLIPNHSNPAMDYM